MSTLTQPQAILITGANRGIGLAIAQSLSLRYPQHIYLLGARTSSSGVATIKLLRDIGTAARFEALELDVMSDESISSVVRNVERKFWISVWLLVNNAGIAIAPPKSGSLSETRISYNQTFNTNITSVSLLTTALLSLLRFSQMRTGIPAKVINISSGRASVTHLVGGNLPPTTVVSYNISKMALNALTIEMQKGEDVRDGEEKVEFYIANPGHCKTEFNGYRGAKDPLDGAEIVVRVVSAGRGGLKPGSFLEFEKGMVREVPW
ncbi:hypothetical protein BGZ60DRAFT_525573 [Tricladium varicosporioides]|nr:hypothetical protein BGZ60DRAFT_525573 [Hymenoscyphus varicosporioides]